MTAAFSRGILVVEDELLVLKYLISVLDHLGFRRILKATNAEQALALLENEQISLIISDVTLPDGDGREIVFRAIEKLPHLVAVLVSGLGCVDLSSAPAAQGRIELLEKPFTIETLSQTLALLAKKTQPSLPS